MPSKKFKAEDLEKVADVSEFHDDREPPLKLGDVVMLNSGGPKMMVVDIYWKNGHVAVAWRANDGTVQEVVFPRPCIHRVSPL